MSAPPPTPSPYQPFTAAQVRASQSMMGGWIRDVNMAMFRTDENPALTSMTIDMQPAVPPHMMERLKGIYTRTPAAYRAVTFSDHGRKMTLDWSIPVEAAAEAAEVVVPVDDDDDEEEEEKKTQPPPPPPPKPSVAVAVPTTSIALPRGRCIHEGCKRDGDHMVRNGEGGRWFCEEHRCKMCPSGTAPHKIELRSTTCRACRPKRARLPAEEETPAKKPRRD